MSLHLLRDALELVSPEGVLTQDILTRLKQLKGVGDLPLEQISTMDGLLLAQTIRAASGHSIPNPLFVANDLLGIVRMALATLKTSTLTVGQQTPSAYANLELDALLAALVDAPDAFDDIQPILAAHPLIVEASKKTNEWVIMRGGQVDVAATVAYVTTLGRLFVWPQRLVDGVRPIGIEQALGMEIPPLINPFSLEPTRGRDSFGIDWSLLSEELHKALLWAYKYGHAQLPVTVDFDSIAEELFGEELPPRWQAILDDYRMACVRDGTNRISSRYYSDGLARQLGRVLRVVCSRPHQGNPDHRILKQATEGDITVDAPGRLVSMGVYDNLHVRADGVRLRDVVVLKGGLISGSNVRGDIYCPHGVDITVTGDGCHVTSHPRSHAELSRLAGLVPCIP